MTLKNKTRGGFTLVELMVVVAMIALVIGAISQSMSGAQSRARVQKATVEVKDMHQAILAYENYANGNELPTMTDTDADRSSLDFLLGYGTSYGSGSGSTVPTLFQASLASNGKILDPWGTPYKVTIKQGSASVSYASASSNMQTGYFFPNYYRLSKEERQ